MKSLAELQAIKDKMKNKIVLREGTGDVRVVVGMATCGIAAGAKPVLNALVEEMAKGEITNARVIQSGCAGMCSLEPVVEVYNKEGQKTIYVKVDPTKAVEILRSDNFAVMLTDVVCISCQNVAGSLSTILEKLAEKDIFIEYMYAFAEGNKANVVIRPIDMDKCVHVLNECSCDIKCKF